MVQDTKIKVRTWKLEDIPAVVECHRAAYPDYPQPDQYNGRIYGTQSAAFPEGQFLAEGGGRVVGYTTSLMVPLGQDVPAYTCAEITGAGAFTTHTPSGDTLYGADIAVHPDFRGTEVASLLYVARRALVGRYNSRRAIAYGRIPGYKAGYQVSGCCSTSWATARASIAARFSKRSTRLTNRRNARSRRRPFGASCAGFACAPHSI